MDERARERKGVYGAAKLPVAARYVRPHGRKTVWGLGFLLGAGLLGWAAYDLFLGRANFVSSGPLSSSHAFLERDQNCGACHTPGASVADASCVGCHEPSRPERGAFSFASHSVYHSGDETRLSAPRVAAHEALACTTCHVEHGGRKASLIPTARTECATCHDFDSFADHPEFEFARLGAREVPGLHDFSHLEHIQQILEERGGQSSEQACVACHEPQPDAKGFEPLSFEEHCSSCHLSSDVTLEAPLRSASRPVGVESFAAIAQRRPAGSEWVQRTNPGEFRSEDGVVVKRPVHHADPWVLHNLRELRAMLYQPGLADLLAASPGASPDPKALHDQALRALRRQLDGLRAVDDRDLQGEVAQLGTRLAQIERALRESPGPIDAQAFEPKPRPEARDEAQVQAIEEVAAQLGGPCFSCHNSDRIAIAPLQADQKSLRRATFDHAPHLLQQRCLDCHQRIPIPSDPRKAKIDSAVDQPETLNLPGVENCQSCHSADQASDACSTCHTYHPGIPQWAGLRPGPQPNSIPEVP